MTIGMPRAGLVVLTDDYILAVPLSQDSNDDFMYYFKRAAINQTLNCSGLMAKTLSSNSKSYRERLWFDSMLR